MYRQKLHDSKQKKVQSWEQKTQRSPFLIDLLAEVKCTWCWCFCSAVSLPGTVDPLISTNASSAPFGVESPGLHCLNRLPRRTLNTYMPTELLNVLQTSSHRLCPWSSQRYLRENISQEDPRTPILRYSNRVITSLRRPSRILMQHVSIQSFISLHVPNLHDVPLC